jgi:hypothetical protein
MCAKSYEGLGFYRTSLILLGSMFILVFLSRCISLVEKPLAKKLDSEM